MKKHLLLSVLLLSSLSVMAQQARISRVVSFTPNEDDTTLPADTTTQQFTYTADGKIATTNIKMVEYDSEGRTTTNVNLAFTYSGNTITGKADLSATKPGGATSTSTENIVYTLTNGLITKEQLTGSGESGTYQYTYDADNRLKAITYSTAGEADETTTVTWNNGNITDMMQASDGQNLQHYVYTYTSEEGSEQIKAFESPLNELSDFEWFTPGYMASMGYYGKLCSALTHTSEIRTVDYDSEYDGEVYTYNYGFNADGTRVQKVECAGTTTEITWTDETNGIHTTTIKGGTSRIFNLNGIRLPELQHGINIIRLTDGSVHKMLH